jgi:hypothetical protein
MNAPTAIPSRLNISTLHTLARLPRGVRLERTQVVGLVLYHALALLAFVP